MNRTIMACVTAYYPENDFAEICMLIAENVDFILIVDNSPDSSLSAKELNLPQHASIVYNKNKGAVAGALNIALTFAREKRVDYLQLFDQDTFPLQEITVGLINTLELNSDICIISPRFINLNTNHPGRVMIDVSKWRIKSIWPRENIGLVNALFTINSASILNMNMLPKDVYYDERLIVDGCDVDFCLFLKTLTLKICVDTSLCITHGIGNRKNGGGRWSPTNYSAYRKYLAAKNRLIVWRRNFNKFPGFVLNDIMVFLLDTGRSIVFEKQRLLKFKSIILGIIDGIREKNVSLRIHKKTKEKSV